MGHPERVMPFCIPSFDVKDAAGKRLHCCEENHHSRYTILLSEPAITDSLDLTFQRPSTLIPAALFEIRCYPS